nr:MAG TPA: hypothetical protein [Caudoviricetes sp.]
MFFLCFGISFGIFLFIYQFSLFSLCFFDFVKIIRLK